MNTDNTNISIYTVHTENYATQESVNHYLESIGMSPVDTVCGTARSLMAHLIHDFMARGGTYEVVEYCTERGLGSPTYPRAYPEYALKVTYADRRLYIWRKVLQACPVMVIRQPWKGSGTSFMPDILVHPDHLDATLCHLLEVPNKGLITHPIQETE